MRASRTIVSLALLVMGACATGCDGASDDSSPKAAALAPAPADAAPVIPTPSPLATAPVSGTHLDGAGHDYQPRTGHVQKANSGKTIELVLRSTPPGATASIDGQAIGMTPTFWSGAADRRPHEFTFVKEGHSMARYRFVATHSGVVHGNLAKLEASEDVAPAPAE